MPHVTPLRASDPRRVGGYQLAGRIAGMPAAGPVYFARSAAGREVTVTLLGADWAAGSAARDRFAAEAASAREVAPFCAARILDAGLEGSRAFLVSEHVAGPSLLEVVSDAGERHGADLEMLAIGAATGLAAIHQAGLVHGDFGPEHLILGEHGPRVVQFGITPPYGAATPSADMRAWAQTVIFAATGRPTAGPEDLDALPPLLRQVVTDCLGADPAARPAARHVLRKLLGDDNPPAGLLAEGSRRAAGPVRPGKVAGQPPGAARQQQPRPAGRHRGGMILWAAGVIATALVAVGLVHVMQDASHPAAKAGSEATGTGASPAATRDASLSAAPSPSAALSPSPSAAASPPAATVPPALAGAWSGQVRQGGPADVFNVKVDLTADGNSGTISYSGASFVCTGDLSLRSSAAGQVTMSQEIVQGQQTCANGMITLRLGSSSGTALFVFRGAVGPRARGTLLAEQ
jgi:hypothetical protein